MNDWNAKLYMKFEKQRTRPAIDLINSLEIESVNRILDVGCGPANSTEQLYKKWKDSEIIGIDSSENMIANAKKRLDNVEFQLHDASKDLSSLGKFDIIFSNAVIQWIPDQVTLIKNLYSILNIDGVLAIQVPNVKNMAISKAISETVNSKKWIKTLASDIGLIMNDINFYYSICSNICSDFNLWVTDYYHIMQSHNAILNWYKSTGLKPYFEQIDSKLHKEFEEEILTKIIKWYPREDDEKVLFPFTRQFMTLYKHKN